jgi:hypothetical protein
MSVYQEKGLNWGAALTNAGQGLSQYADMLRQQQAEEEARARQDKLLAGQWARQDRLTADERKYQESLNPVVFDPSKSVPFNLGAPGGTLDMTNFLPPVPLRRSDMIPLYKDNLDTQQMATRDAVLQGYGVDDAATQHRYRMEEIAAQNANRIALKGIRANGSIEPNGGLTNAEVNGYSKSYVPDEMVGLYGDAFRGAFEVDFRSRLESGNYFTPTGGIDAVRAAQDAKDATLGSWQGLPNFGPRERYDVNGAIEWSDPALYSFKEGEVKPGWLKDTKDEMTLNIPANTVPTAKAMERKKEETFFNEEVAPYVRNGLVSHRLLKKWMTEKKIPWTEENVNAWLQNGMTSSSAATDAQAF